MSETQNSIPENAPKISVDDIKNAVRIIDFAAEQGAFKGWKVVEQVLLVRNRLNEFVSAVAPDEAPATDESTAQTTTSLNTEEAPNG